MSSIARFLIPFCLAAFSLIADEPQKAPAEEISDSSLRDLLVKGLDAVSAKELDAPLAKLAQMQKQATQDPTHLSLNFGLVRAAQEILVAYQDGLLGTPSRNNISSADRLQQAATSWGVSFAGLLPRSEFMEKIKAASERLSGSSENSPSAASAETQIINWVRGVKKVEDMDAALQQIDALLARAPQTNDNRVNLDVANLFRQYCNVYHEMRAGQATSLQVISSYSVTAGADATANIRDLIIRYALPRVLQTPVNLVQKAGETTLGFLQRVMAKARDISDWPLLARTLETAQTMGLSAIVSSEDSNGLRNFLGGINQEQANFWAGAVSSYLAALKSGSQAVPAEYIGKRLAEIRERHPDDFAAGTKTPTTGYNSIEQRLGRPFPGYPSRQNTLSVPALPKSKEPASSPKSLTTEEKSSH